MAKKERKTVTWQGKNSKGKDVTLLTPTGKGAKYSQELREQQLRTNTGKLKVDKDGSVLKPSSEQIAYRKGYLAAQYDGMDAYLATKAKSDKPADVKKFETRKEKKRSFWASRKK